MVVLSVVGVNDLCVVLGVGSRIGGPDKRSLKVVLKLLWNYYLGISALLTGDSKMDLSCLYHFCFQHF